MTSRKLTLLPMDDDALKRLVEVAVADAHPDEVTPPLTPGSAWTPERVSWLCDFHRDRRGGLDGPKGEATWAVLAEGSIIGSVRLKRTAESGVLQTGLWLARATRKRGWGRLALAACLREAVLLGVSAVQADTTADNGGALTILRDLGFDLTRDADGTGVTGSLSLVHRTEP